MKSIWAASALAAALVLSAAGNPAQARGSDMSPQDMAAIKAYPLTMDKFNKWATAEAALKRDEKKNPGLKAAENDNSKQQSIADTLALLKRHPEVANYFRKAGLSDMDTVLIPIVAMSASMATMVPEAKWGELPVSRQQILFMKAHQKEMAALSSGGD